MRVITGSARGRMLKTLKGDATRPTTEKVKEAIFSAVQFNIEGRRVLDLFAGSGQLGIEALSRGAITATFVDSSREAVGIIRENLQTTGFTAQSIVLCRDAQSVLIGITEAFDLVFVDPPYALNKIPSLLPALLPHLAPGATVICEHEGNQPLPEQYGSLSVMKIKRYGRIGITIYRNR